MLIKARRLFHRYIFLSCLMAYATSLALWRITCPCSSFFLLKIHLQPTALRPSGKCTSSHVPFSWSASISSCIATCHAVDSALLIASA
uniref:Putative secreted protein n=1 Tax=Anopheles darlingi TaxID=43151 RepID=A0A2M4DN04_ANODA